jgi:hypothetical protein
MTDIEVRLRAVELTRIRMTPGIVGDYDGAYDIVRPTEHDLADNQLGDHPSAWSGESYHVEAIADFAALAAVVREMVEEKAGQIRAVDDILARRRALDPYPARVDKILHAIKTAKEVDQLRATLAEREREIERVKADMDAMRLTLAHSARELERLREALKNYGGHEDLCQYWRNPNAGGDDKCDCGYAAALRSTPGAGRKPQYE